MNMRTIVMTSFDEAVKEVDKSQKVYYGCLLAMMIYIALSICLLIAKAEAILFMFVFLIFIVPSLPLIAYFFLGVIIYASLSMARKRLEKARENYSYWEFHKIKH